MSGLPQQNAPMKHGISAKRAYVAPKLAEYGSLAKLTRATTGKGAKSLDSATTRTFSAG